MAWFKNGTVNVTYNSDIVIGNNANFDSTIRRGDILVVDGKNYEIDGVVNSLQLKLASPFSGGTGNGVNYGIIHTNAQVQELSQDVNTMIELAAEIIENGVEGGDSAYETAVKNGFVGTEQQWLDSLHGEDGRDGSQVGLGAIVNWNEYTGQAAGSSGMSVIVPVTAGDPPMNLTQTAQVVIPTGNKDAGIAIWAKMQTSGLAVVMGLVNAPEPLPGGSDEELDLSGSGTVYGDPGTIFPLGIYLAGSTASFTLTAPSSFPLRIERRTEISVPVASQWNITSAGSPYAVGGDAVSTSNVLYKRVYSGSGGASSDNSQMINGRLRLMRHIHLASDPLALNFKQTTNDGTTQTPASIRLTFSGIVNEEYPVLASLYDYMVGEFTLRRHWQGTATLAVTVGRGSSTTQIVSADDPAFAAGAAHVWAVEFIDNVGGAGGTIRFYSDGVQIGPDQTCEVKLRATPAMAIECNSTGNNTSDSVNNLDVAYIGVSFGKPEIQSNYESATSGPISAADLQMLCVDARSFSTAQTPVTVSYAAAGQQAFNMEVVVGEMILPAGRAYKAVLEDWSSGSGVAHPNELIMTRPAAQNCRFEDADLYGAQAAWTEVLPKGPVPNIGGINYYCEGIRMGTYVQFQFGYDWDETQMPHNPFGNPEGKNSYMVPHKWLIYDNAGTLLGRIEQANGQPLNTTNEPTMWSGTLDGRGNPIITAANKWTPKGTVRSGIIWRSHAEPPAYSQADIWKRVPTYDIAVPFASQGGASVNGGDLRLSTGEQLNGFANYRWMPWESSTYNDMITAGQNTLNPWKYGTDQNGMVPNAGVWLKYTPFNQMGRSLITGPGGVRDDRQMMPEPVARYARDVTVKRPHDNRDMKQIALDYLTGYVSDPYQAFEKGRLTPLYKDQPRRNITLRNHYYGAGEAGTPPEQAYYIQGGRPYEFVTATNPLRVQVPYAGATSDKPYFGTNQIDADHAHQFPYWGSLLWQTPEFAFLGHKLSDQSWLYIPWILNNGWGQAGEFASRGPAWKYMHLALMWKTASSNSSRLYNRDEILDRVVFDFEGFYDNFYDSTPGFLNPPTTIATDDGGNSAMFAAAQHFGPCLWNDDYGVYQHEFFIGYWLSALHAAEKLGFNAALRAASPKAEAVVNWLITCHQKRITGRLNGGMEINSYEIDYTVPLWTPAMISAAGRNVASLPKTYGAIITQQGSNKAFSWDVWNNNGNQSSRDGQSMDQLLAGASLLRDMGRTDSALVTAETNSLAFRQSKIDSETAKGAQTAGSTWFQYHQTTNNPPFKP
ncbi:hypothetical protein [Sphingobium lactosutens]|jgi:hypothetical protein|uniref:hypothetical protein n=1 Tax=Sphingobium lactosutens TaxID=522773 RepID=UPI001D193422|nr:hypothetical protein [Sphingobium lactosutens]MCC4257014.1 hypothetical protein [Sphingobium lactosutens]